MLAPERLDIKLCFWNARKVVCSWNRDYIRPPRYNEYRSVRTSTYPPSTYLNSPAHYSVRCPGGRLLTRAEVALASARLGVVVAGIRGPPNDVRIDCKAAKHSDGDRGTPPADLVHRTDRKSTR